MILGLAGIVLALLVVLPFRTVDFTRSDGVVVKLPAPDRLNHTSDTWDYLQIAREIYRSHSYESLFTYVPFLPDWEGSAREERGRFPVLWRQPGFPLLVAGAFALRGEADPGVLCWIQAMAIVLLPLVTYALALSIVAPPWAFAAALWTLLVPLGLSPSSPLVATTWFAVIAGLLAASILRSTRAWIVAVSGVLLGLAIAFRLEAWFLVPGLLLMLWMGRPSRRSLHTILLLGVAALVLVPWTRCRAQCAGETFTLTSLLYHDTDAFPGWTSSRTLAVRELSAIGFVTDHFGDVMKKTVLNLLRYGRDLVVLPSPFLAPFVWLAFLRPPAAPSSRAFVMGTLLMACVLVVALAPLEYSPRFIAVLVPFFAITAALGMERFVRHRRILIVGATVIGVLFMSGALVGRGTDGTARLAALDLNEVMRQPATASIALCDTPTIYAWIWDGRAVWTPVAEDVEKVLDLLEPFDLFAIFTRAGGHGDGLEPDIVGGYLRAGLKADTSELPIIMYESSPAETHQGTSP